LPHTALNIFFSSTLAEGGGKGPQRQNALVFNKFRQRSKVSLGSDSGTQRLELTMSGQKSNMVVFLCPKSGAAIERSARVKQKSGCLVPNSSDGQISLHPASLARAIGRKIRCAQTVICSDISA
jgi:hypothetical protein